MKIRKGLLAGLLMMATAMAAPAAAEGGSLARSVFRGTMKGATRAFLRGPARILRRDLLRDRATRVRPLARNRTVFRYTTKRQARQELRRGIRPGSHTTSRAVPGRAPSPVARLAPAWHSAATVCPGSPRCGRLSTCPRAIRFDSTRLSAAARGRVRSLP